MSNRCQPLFILSKVTLISRYGFPEVSCGIVGTNLVFRSGRSIGDLRRSDVQTIQSLSLLFILIFSDLQQFSGLRSEFAAFEARCLRRLRRKVSWIPSA